MREIKFRGFDEENNCWRYGWYTRLVEGARAFDAIICFEDDGVLTRYYIHDDATIGQFTGLIDKNGNKIFEGDIIEFKNIDRQYVKGIVYYLGSCFLIESIVADEDDYNLGGVFSTAEGLIKVIGNIHDYPELLGGE